MLSVISLLTSTGTPLPAAAESKLRAIDSHIHLWDLPRSDGARFPPGPEVSWLYQPRLLDDYLATGLARSVAGIILVESSVGLTGAANDRANQWMIDHAHREPLILGMVGKLDFADPAFSAKLQRLAASPVFLGLRFGRGLTDANGDLRPAAAAAFARMAELRLSVDILGISPLTMAGFAGRIPPELHIILDHFGGKSQQLAIEADWAAGIRALAPYPNIFVKVSDWHRRSAAGCGATWPDRFDPETRPEAYAPLFELLYETLGADRLIWGSNWPVSDMAAVDPGEQIGLLQSLMNPHPPSHLDRILYQNAVRAYRLPPGVPNQAGSAETD